MNNEAKKTKDPDAKKKRLKKIFWTLMAILLMLLIALLYYLLTGRPITRLLPFGPKNPPRYVTSIYGDFKYLTGIAVNKNGTRFYAVDTGKQKVFVFDRNGKQLSSFGKAGSLEVSEKEEGFLAPLFDSVGPGNNVYVTDRLGYRISIYSPLGKFIKYFAPMPGSLFVWSPLAIDVDNKGLVYITDAKKGENRVIVFEKSGKLIRKFGNSGRGKGQFAFPNGITVNDEGRIFVADSNNARVQAFDPKGKYLFSFRKGPNIEITRPSGIDATRNNEVLVVESFGHEIQAYDYEGYFLYKFGKMGLGKGQFKYPQGIAVASDGRVYIIDRGNNRIQIWQY